MQERCSEEELALVAILSRNIWLRRNAVIHEEIFKHPGTMLKNAQATLEEFQKACSTTPDNQPSRSEAPLPQWQAPSKGKIKVNRDAALDKTSGFIGFGVIARDSEGQVLAARCYSKQVCIDPIMAESWAGLQAVLFCKEVGLFDIVLQ